MYIFGGVEVEVVVCWSVWRISIFDVSYPKIRFIWQNQISKLLYHLKRFWRKTANLFIFILSSHRGILPKHWLSVLRHIVWLSPSRLKRGKQHSPARTTTEKELFTQDGVETLFCNKKDLGDVGHCNSLKWRYPMKIKWRKRNRRVPLCEIHLGVEGLIFVAFQPTFEHLLPRSLT